MTRAIRLLISVFIVIVISSMPIIAGAATATSLPTNFVGNVDYLIDIRNPETSFSTTTNRNCVISAVAAKGSKVVLYSLNAAGTAFEVMRDAYGNILESTVGASGLYVQQIALKDGKNTILVVASSSASICETIRLDVSLLNQGYMDNVNGSFKSYGIGVIDIFN